MIRIKKLDHVVLRAQDPERIVEFYCLVSAARLNGDLLLILGLFNSVLEVSLLFS